LIEILPLRLDYIQVNKGNRTVDDSKREVGDSVIQ
jgi:hypothetical protein